MGVNKRSKFEFWLYDFRPFTKHSCPPKKKGAGDDVLSAVKTLCCRWGWDGSRSGRAATVRRQRPAGATARK